MSSLFQYDLHETSIAGKNGRTMVCFHGYGANYQIAQSLADSGVDATLVSFNFPDHDLFERAYEPEDLSFGSMRELLPALYVLKKTVVDQGLNAIDLYGFSAGGAAVINCIAVLNGSKHDKELKKIGISAKVKEKLLQAIQKGIVILDCPLKSIEEIIEVRGSTEELERIAKSYQDHGLVPLKTVELLKGLSLNILLFFQDQDEVIFNRDDQKFIARLEKTNCLGMTTVIIEDEGGHNSIHPSLWKAYKSLN